MRAACEPLPSVPQASKSESQAARVRIAWLCNRFRESDISTSLIELFAAHDCDAWLFDLLSLPAHGNLDFDLIVMVDDGPQSKTCQQALERIRLNSRSPLVVIARSTQAEQAIAWLVAGADAVFQLDTSHAVILAHSQALLRRWLGA